MAVNVPPRNVRRFIMPDLPQRQSRQKFKMWPGIRITSEIGRRTSLEGLAALVETGSGGGDASRLR